MFTHHSPAMPSMILWPSLSVSQTPLPCVMIRTPFLASAAFSVNGCMWCAASSACNSAVGMWLVILFIA
ncbi:MAG: hypothetical protein ACD_54C01280G0002 [uncultured bacterium]|nr:MAG: hypothetical protein ACD_54C01280G0002 [uncultured bacterium]